MEYTILSVGASIVAFVLDRALGTRVLARKEFWIFMAVMVVFETAANGYLTARPIVQYGAGHYLGMRLGTIPVEDYLYGFAFITMVVTLWERMRREY